MYLNAFMPLFCMRGCICARVLVCVCAPVCWFVFAFLFARRVPNPSLLKQDNCGSWKLQDLENSHRERFGSSVVSYKDRRRRRNHHPTNCDLA